MGWPFGFWWGQCYSSFGFWWSQCYSSFGFWWGQCYSSFGFWWGQCYSSFGFWWGQCYSSFGFWWGQCYSSFQFVCVMLSVFLYCLSSFSVLCSKCCQCLWIVHFWLTHCCSWMFLSKIYKWDSNWINMFSTSFNNTTNLIRSKITFT